MTWQDDKGLDANMPCVSVIIATRNRPHDVMCAVQSVARGIEQVFEIVVVDQSDDDATRVALYEACHEDGRIRYVRDTGRGAARARNLGLRAARADIMAVIDDDCLAPPSWLADILAAFQRYPDVELLFGRVEAPPHDYRREVIPVLLLSQRQRRVERSLRGRGGRLEGISANMAMRSSLFVALDGFDPRFGVGGERWSAEDFELHYRALRLGKQVLIEPGIAVLHLGKRKMEDAWELWRRDALGCGAVAAHVARAGSPLVAAHLWWWNIGRVLWNGAIHAITLRFPTGLRLGWWMAHYFREGFRQEWWAGESEAAAHHEGGLVRRGSR
ncbi:MAG TPA: glycosyltransferase family 2 protein [Ktedonobacterales bacterium]